MVFNFLRGGPSVMESVEREVTAMLANCRHTFDLAMSALFAGDDIAAIAEDIHTTDERINAAEEQVRRQLVVHVSVQGAEDVGTVMVDLLIVKKLERIGDQHKNVLDLAEEGVRLTGAPDEGDIQALRQEISAMFETTAAVLTEADEEGAQALGDRATELRQHLEGLIRDMIHTDLPATEAVPRALLYRHLKRIVANLGGVAMTVVDGIERIERDSSGEDITDD
ncbi:PhoU domain-containing protein [Euzebya sp.]|uniref:PhoU domain-containing protein n=1 Tax=Euzebya sp. TaxID=1971409 RepID=UPI0035184728